MFSLGSQCAALARQTVGTINGQESTPKNDRCSLLEAVGQLFFDVISVIVFPIGIYRVYTHIKAEENLVKAEENLVKAKERFEEIAEKLGCSTSITIVDEAEEDEFEEVELYDNRTEKKRPEDLIEIKPEEEDSFVNP